jgi:hypothetical protein
VVILVEGVPQGMKEWLSMVIQPWSEDVVILVKMNRFFYEI